MTKEKISILFGIQIILFIAAFAVGVVSLLFVESLVAAACVLVEFVTFYNMTVLTAMSRALGFDSEENLETDSDDKERRSRQNENIQNYQKDSPEVVDRSHRNPR